MHVVYKHHNNCNWEGCWKKTVGPVWFIRMVYFSKWFSPRSISSSYCVIVKVRVVIVLTTWLEVIFGIKWKVFVSQWCCKSGPLNMINMRLTECKWAKRKGAVHHQLINHNIDWDPAQCFTYSKNYFQRLAMESWYTNLEQTPLKWCQQLPEGSTKLMTYPWQTWNQQTDF